MQPVTKDNAMYDLNGDGIISTYDLIILLSQLLLSRPIGAPCRT